MRKSTKQDIARLCSAHEEKHEFKGILCSIDCINWEWKNCPNGWKGQYTKGDQKLPKILLEVVASYDLWICHAFFAMEDSNNDLNVLNQSTLCDELKRGIAPPASFNVNGHHYTKGYYLVGDIYP
ncbi:uncharacterized protein [Rutidosis leptorrhynchoides]|uniref:uncharacterized protein n=1 Tax=Rutidosis leptorrhynchoides TaxID=125765 RepID=UPI003A9A28E6